MYRLRDGYGLDDRLAHAEARIIEQEGKLALLKKAVNIENNKLDMKVKELASETKRYEEELSQITSAFI